jgi:hypothetical protein
MPFDYLHSKVPRCYQQAPEKAEGMYLKELEERAELLYRLHYDKQDVKRRLRGNLRWDWECNPSPSFFETLASAVEDVVERVFSRPRPPVKGRIVRADDLKIKPSD